MTRPSKTQILNGEAIAPFPGTPQEEALANPADIVIYGGAAGGGKSYSLLLAALRGYGDKNYRAALFRRTFPQLSTPKGLIDESGSLFPHVGAHYNQSKHTWSFPSGAWLKFSHLQHTKNLADWDGAQLCFVGMDQLEQFDQRSLFYLQGRCRAPEYSGKCQVFATCNPAGETHWLTQLIDWWLKPAPDGVGLMPNLEKSGKLRYCFREGDKIKWVDKSARDEDGNPPISISFVAARVEDNPAIMEKDPKYLQRLNSLSFVDKMEKKEGRWGVGSLSGPFSRHAIQVKSPEEIPAVQWVRYWDLADTEPHAGNKNPCHTAGVKTATIYRQWSICGFNEEQGGFIDEHGERSPCGWWSEGGADSIECPECGKRSVQTDRMPIVIIGGATWFMLSGSIKKQRMISIAQQDGRNTVVALELEGGSMGKESGDEYKRNVFPKGFRVELDRPTGAKAIRHSDLVPLAETGRMWLISGEWNADYIRALETMTPLDVVDATAGGYKVSQNYRKPTKQLSTKPKMVHIQPVIDIGF